MQTRRWKYKGKIEIVFAREADLGKPLCNYGRRPARRALQWSIETEPNRTHRLRKVNRGIC